MFRTRSASGARGDCKAPSGAALHDPTARAEATPDAGARARSVPEPLEPGSAQGGRARSERYEQTKSIVVGMLLESIDFFQLSRLSDDTAREEIRNIVNEIISLKKVVMPTAEQEQLLNEICNHMLGEGPARAAAPPPRR